VFGVADRFGEDVEGFYHTQCAFLGVGSSLNGATPHSPDPSTHSGAGGTPGFEAITPTFDPTGLGIVQKPLAENARHEQLTADRMSKT
jgi:hypothetical protein